MGSAVGSALLNLRYLLRYHLLEFALPMVLTIENIALPILKTVANDDKAEIDC